MNKIITIPLLLIILSFSSCKNDQSGALTRLNVKITDSPGAYDALLLSVKEIHVRTSAGETSMPVDAGPFDILKFRMGKDTLLAAEDIPSGRLQEIRLILNETGNEVIVDGKSFDLKTPAGQSSGVKIKVQDELTSGVAYTLVLDFDAAKSVVRTGNGSYLLKPVIRALPQAVSGALTGMVSPAASNPKIYAIKGVDTVGAVADTLGKFFFPGLAAGSYKVDIVPVAPYVSKSIEGVEVTTGSVKDLGTVNIAQ